jgi:predicted PurR-regulated permease PerM/GAF domain-containing protein
MKAPALLKSKGKNAASEALFGIYVVVLATAVICALYFGRVILIPLALAALLTFMLAPLIAHLERWIKRGPAIGSVAVIIFVGLGFAAWVISRQALDLAGSLPNYTANVEQKLRALELSQDGPVTRVSQMVAKLETETPGEPGTEKGVGEELPRPRKEVAAAAPPRPGDDAATPLVHVQSIVAPFLGIVGTAGLVMVLVVFMLLNREDLHGRLVKLIGGDRISTTSKAFEDAGDRVARYLLTQLAVNLAFGAVIATGLYLIGIPNAFLWGSLAAALRFIPYVGVWIAAVCPVAVALTVSPGWQLVLLTFGLFAVLELVLGNLLEPLLYKSSTGVSSLALIVAALFWTWVWGPAGLLLSTPLTVCLVVLGRHVPRLAFFHTLLGNERALSAVEQCYHHLLVGGMREALQDAEAYVASHSLTALFDDVLLPTIVLAEMDFHRGDLDERQQLQVLQGVRDIVEDLGSRPLAPSRAEADLASAVPPSELFLKADCRVACIPVKGARDEISGAMLVHLLRQQGFPATLAGAGEPMASLLEWLAEQKADVVCLSVIPPSTALHARHLCKRVRDAHPDLKVVIGLWGVPEGGDQLVGGAPLRKIADVVGSLAEALVHLGTDATALLGDMVPAAVPLDEEQRLLALMGLKAYAAKSDPAFDRMTRQLTRTFDVPVALVTLIDRNEQLFKSQCGLPEELSGVTTVPREAAVCSHVVAGNGLLVVEDLSRDRRFANNPLLKQHHFRFYAGVPLRAANGQPVGALCILDTRPRLFGEADRRLLTLLGAEISEGLALSVPGAPTQSESGPMASAPGPADGSGEGMSAAERA